MMTSSYLDCFEFANAGFGVFSTPLKTIVVMSRKLYENPAFRAVLAPVSEDEMRRVNDLFRPGGNGLVDLGEGVTSKAVNLKAGGKSHYAIATSLEKTSIVTNRTTSPKGLGPTGGFFQEFSAKEDLKKDLLAKGSWNAIKADADAICGAKEARLELLNPQTPKDKDLGALVGSKHIGRNAFAYGATGLEEISEGPGLASRYQAAAFEHLYRVSPQYAMIKDGKPEITNNLRGHTPIESLRDPKGALAQLAGGDRHEMAYSLATLIEKYKAAGARQDEMGIIMACRLVESGALPSGDQLEDTKFYVLGLKEGDEAVIAKAALLAAAHPVEL